MYFSLFQTAPSFTDPYDSKEIGYYDVSKMRLIPETWEVQDIDTKCFCLPKDSKYPSPMPKELQRLLLRNQKNTPMSVKNALEAAFGNQIPHWCISTLLFPGKYK